MSGRGRNSLSQEGSVVRQGRSCTSGGGAAAQTLQGRTQLMLTRVLFLKAKAIDDLFSRHLSWVPPSLTQKQDSKQDVERGVRQVVEQR